MSFINLLQNFNSLSQIKQFQFGIDYPWHVSLLSPIGQFFYVNTFFLVHENKSSGFSHSLMLEQLGVVRMHKY